MWTVFPSFPDCATPFRRHSCGQIEVRMHQVTHWVDVASAVVDGLLLLRFLQLRFFSVYTFAVLFASVNVIFDAVSLATPANSELGARLFLFSKLVVLFVFPLAAWESLDLSPPPVLRLRQMYSVQLGGSFIVMFVVAFLLTFLSATDNATTIDLWGQVGFFSWPVSALLSFIFLWKMRAALNSQKLEIPPNGRVLSKFFRWVFAIELLSWLALVTTSGLNRQTPLDILAVCLNCAGMGISMWCIFRLKSLTVSTVPESST